MQHIITMLNCLIDLVSIERAQIEERQIENSLKRAT